MTLASPRAPLSGNTVTILVPTKPSRSAAPVQAGMSSSVPPAPARSTS